MQAGMRPERLAAEAVRLLTDEVARERMRAELGDIRDQLTASEHPLDRAVRILNTVLNKETVNAR
jgi:hypothetical protein